MERKLFGKFNIIDIILFSIIVLALIAAVVRIFWNSSSEYEDAEITAVFVSENLHGEAIGELTVGSELINQADDSVIGKIVAVDMRGDGTVAITVFSEGSRLKHGISIEGTTYFIGSEASVVSGDAVLDAYLSKFDTSVK